MRTAHVAIAPDDPAGMGEPDGFARKPKNSRRSRHARNGLVIALNFGFTLALVGVVVAGFAFLVGKRSFEAPGPLVQEATVMVPRGGGLSAIAANLERNGVVSDALVFEYGVRLQGVGGELKAGEYAFAPGISMRGAMDVLRSGNSIQHSFTIPEGWTVRQVFDRLAADPVLVGDMPAMAPEGTLLPET